MVSNSSDLKITLEKHGSKVINALGVIVLALQTDDDAKLLGKVKEVLYITKMLLILLIAIHTTIKTFKLFPS